MTVRDDNGQFTGVPTLCHKCGLPIGFDQPITWLNIMFAAAGSVPSVMKPHHASCVDPSVWPPQTIRPTAPASADVAADAAVAIVDALHDANMDDTGESEAVVFSRSLAARGYVVRGAVTCAARAGNIGPNDPQDCDWPFCGCDPQAQKVIDALDECGYLLKPIRSQATLPPDLAAIRARCEAATEKQRKRHIHDKPVEQQLAACQALCDPDCEGRCNICPQEIVNDAISEIKQLRTDISTLLTALTAALAEGSKHLDDVLMLQGFCDDRDKQIATLTSQLSAARAALRPGGIGASLLRKASGPLPPGCYCKPGKCMAPKIMGRQMPCRDPEKAVQTSAEKEG